MHRFPILGIVFVLLLVPVARGQDTEERIRDLEQRLESQKKDYEEKIEALNRRLAEVESGGRTEEGSELDRLLAEAEAEATSAEESAGGAAGLLSGQTRPNAFNPRITAFGDFVGRLDNRPVMSEHHHGDEADTADGAREDDRAALRSFELDFRADVDPFAKAVAVVGLHEHAPDDFAIHPEEVYVTFETLPWRLRAKVGKFLASMGVTNRLHPHDLPQTTLPLVNEHWLGEEGMNAQGAELSWLVPQSLADSIEVTFGLFSGELDYLAGGDSNDPAFLGRVAVFETLSDSEFLQVGTSHLVGWTDADGKHSAWLGGLDVMYRWRPTDRPFETSLFAQAELFLSDRETEEGTTKSLGAYGLVQYQPWRDIYVGTRFDWMEPLDRFEGHGRAWAGGLWLSYYTSEFLRLRLGYEHRGIVRADDLDTLWLQVTFVFGSHPVEPYWFNK